MLHFNYCCTYLNVNIIIPKHIFLFVHPKLLDNFVFFVFLNYHVSHLNEKACSQEWIHLYLTLWKCLHEMIIPKLRHQKWYHINTNINCLLFKNVLFNPNESEHLLGVDYKCFQELIDRAIENRWSNVDISDIFNLEY